MGRPIPEVREDMLALADDLCCSEHADRLRELVSDTYRVKYTRKGHSRRKMTAAIRDEIKILSLDDSLTQQEIGEKVNVTAGRVSETLHGKWDHLR